ncbi:hypothetical protein IscW_ISCW015809 [Ixodes scapularis]|uniref:Uncharacterized protein n=1 Tax=Ixodes scapularis TaxID=6945 RepID=B7P4E5_IXOSC|nr:hypothetical protein IscW_ISCW015809 [Ixodes scapularis]|eukprot:XP_002405911.1 hypothetical protein IscW_ISCW015809 [Ixodes scapularis]
MPREKGASPGWADLLPLLVDDDSALIPAAFCALRAKPGSPESRKQNDNLAVPAAGELCTVNEVVTPCSVDAAGRFVCVKSATKGQCVDWSSQNRCLGGSGSRFRTLAGCEAMCRAEGPGGCRSPQACLCSGAFRATNYVFDGELQQCRLLPEHRCLDREQGFTDRRRCEETCRVGSGAGGQDGRCQARPVEGLLRQCRWSDQRFTFYYDASTKRCRRWDDGACVSGAHALLQDCLAHC